MRPAPSPKVLGWLDQRDASDFFLSTISVAEIGFGLRILPEGARRRTLSSRFQTFLRRGFGDRLLSFDAPAAEAYAELMAHRRRIGRPMSSLDGQLAAIARSRNLAVATRNLRDFEECGVELFDPFGP